MSEGVMYYLGTFNKHVGEKFQLRLESGPRTLELIEAEGRPGHLGDDSRNFALVFHDPESSVAAHLPQSIYQLEHETLGEVQLFLVPIGPGRDNKGIDYEAAFSAPC